MNLGGLNTAPATAPEELETRERWERTGRRSVGLETLPVEVCPESRWPRWQKVIFLLTIDRFR